MTGASSAVARQAVRSLRARDITTAAATSKHPRITSRAVSAIEPPPSGKPYKDLDDWIETWDAYDGDYDYEDYETSADY